MKYQLVAVCLIFVGAPVFARPADNSPSNSEFSVAFDAGAITRLARSADSAGNQFVASKGRLGDVAVKYRQNGTNWLAASTASITASVLSLPGMQHAAYFQITNKNEPAFTIENRFTVEKQAVVWKVGLKNQTSKPLEIGDLAIPLPISRSVGKDRKVLLKHSFISGNGSFLFWLRSDSAAPFLVLVPDSNTQLEYWEGSREDGYRVFIHSAVAGEIAREHGTKWRQPNTSLTLAPEGQAGDSQTYGFKFRWADNYDGVRQILMDEGGIDTQVVPGMTVPNDLSAEFSLRTKQPIQSIKPEFPEATQIESLGEKQDMHVFKVRFSKLGENRVSIHYGKNQHLFLEFFCTEPLETLIKKRAAFIAHSQYRDPAKWYNGLITDWNMDNETMPSPDYYAPIPRGRVYAVTCDDPGLGKPAFLAAKNAEYPSQSEVEALDYYIQHFVWGGLQRTTEEKYSYAIYGIPNWKTNRDSADHGRNGQLHFWRVYDYPHVIQMYFAMYRMARNNPQIKTALTAREYLQRASGTAQAMFTIPHEVWNGWSAYGTGFYNEVVIPDLINELDANGLTGEAKALRGFWLRKVKTFVNDEPDLFRSEYAFDSTGFESTHAFAKYAMLHADQPGETNSGIPLANAQRFMEMQMTANIFCRGWLEPAYYYLGSDYRGGAGNMYVLTYMSQMGGWSVLDYGLNFATNPAPYVRLGYASFLSAWALMNTGTPESNYGYWYPGKQNDGGAGGGFEPAPYGQTWLGQPHHRGSWYYSSEIDLGYCGALRTAATVVADDPIFGRFCFGGDWKQAANMIEIMPKDGLRRRFHALLNGQKVHLMLEADRFAASKPLALKEDFSEIRIPLESENASPHLTKLHLSGLAGDYEIRSGNSKIDELHFKDGDDLTANLPVNSSDQSSVFYITRLSR
jgi:hypothetical protein